jgi:predicted O-methyltransferase YrrM
VPSWRIYDQAFQNAVEKLRVPAAGTDVVAPLLSFLVQFVRPASVLEVGMGYTTPFLAATLAEAEQRSRLESSALAGKTRPYLAEGRELDHDWLNAEPALLRPAFYREPYRPKFVAVDNLSVVGSSAKLVQDVLDELGLRDAVTVVNADLRECRDRLPAGFAPIDLAWVDAWECLYFFDHFWELINPAGGLVVMHYLMTYPEGEAILDYIAKVQRAKPGQLEMLNLLEPHKMVQNSITVLRRTSGGRPAPYAKAGGKLNLDGELREDATAHVASCPEVTQSSYSGKAR